MSRIKQSFAYILITFVFFLSFPQIIPAEEGAPPSGIAASPKVQQLIESGKLTPQQVQEGIKAYQKGEVSPEKLKELLEKGKLGTLSPAEIEAGKKLLEEKKEQAKKKAEPEARVEPEKEAEEPFESEEEFFKKTGVAGRPSLQIFGHKLFSSAPSTFAPIKAVPVSNDYIIGPGDEIKIYLWGRIETSYSLEVDNEGVIDFPKIGPLIVAGLSFGKLKELIKHKGETITGVNVSVSMGRLRTIQVFALGEVKAPGLYTVSSLSKVTNALLSSGGPTRLGSLRKVQLKRQGKVVSTIDFYDFLLKGDTSSDARIMPGDVIFVPQAGPMVSVSGGVRRPAIYEVKTKRNLLTVLNLAGGLRPRAYNQRIQIERAFENRMQIVLDISYEELRQKKEIPVQDGDLIRVFSILPSAVNAVYLYGNVLRPGQYEYKPGLRVLNILPDLESLDLDTHLDYALIKRYRFGDMEAELIPFDLARLLFSKDETQNIPLVPLDEVYVFNKWMFEDREYAVVSGQVRRPGRYFIDDMRVRDLILKAGDLTDDAYLPKAEIIRIEEDRDKDTIYFDVAAAMADDPKHNLRVQDEDRVVIHSIWEEQWKEFVTIKGQIKDAGQYTLTRGMRLEDLIFKAGTFSRDAYMELGHLYRTDWRTKEVTIHTFNVQKALEGDPQHNLLLEDLDSVDIHSIWEYVEKYTVSIKGMVNKPGEYLYATNMTVKDLVMVAGNVNEAAYMDEAELFRSKIVQGKSFDVKKMTFSLSGALQGDPDHNIKLQPYDELMVKPIPDWRKVGTALVRGEVAFPGQYTIEKGERLVSLLNRAGGYTEDAFLRGARLTRKAVRISQQAHLKKIVKMLEAQLAREAAAIETKAQTAEDIQAMKESAEYRREVLDKMKEIEAPGRISILFKPLDEMADARDNITLEHGDTIMIPEHPGTVHVMGMVYNSMAFLYRPDMDLDKYLELGGGVLPMGDKKRLYLEKAEGTTLQIKRGFRIFSANRYLPGMRATVEEGDSIIVPESPELPGAGWKKTREFVDFIYNTAASMAVLKYLFE